MVNTEHASVHICICGVEIPYQSRAPAPIIVQSRIEYFSAIVE